MGPLNAPRALDVDEQGFADKTWSTTKIVMPLPKLDLSKFPSKKTGKDGKTTNLGGLKIPRKTDLGLRKNRSSQLSKNMSPQVVRACAPVGKGGPKTAGSLVFAYKARPMDVKYDDWNCGGVQQMPTNSVKGTGRYGRMTSFEIDVITPAEESWQYGRGWSPSPEIGEDDRWLADPEDESLLVDACDDGASNVHECEPPRISLDNSEPGDDFESGLVGFEPLHTSSSEHYAYFEAPSLCDGSKHMMDKERSVDLPNICDNDVPSAATPSRMVISPQPSELKRVGAVKKKVEDGYLCGNVGAESKEHLPDSSTWRTVRKCQSAPKERTSPYNEGWSMKEAYESQSSNKWPNGKVNVTSLDCPPPPVYSGPLYPPSSIDDAPHQPSASGPSVESTKDIVYTYGNSLNMESDMGITYREACGTQQSMRPRRHSTGGFVRKVLGVTLGLTSSAFMLVSGVMVTKAIMNAGNHSALEYVEESFAEEEYEERDVDQTQSLHMPDGR